MNIPIGLAAYATPVNAPAALLNKTKRLRKVHFVFADTNSHECNTPINDKTLYTRWAPSVTCKECRELMVAKGVTSGMYGYCLQTFDVKFQPILSAFSAVVPPLEMRGALVRSVLEPMPIKYLKK